jgi:hypothetical protein
MRGAPWLFSGATPYTGQVTGTDTDGDGIADAVDNCPTMFNPLRPLDLGKQADADGDGVGDLCDVCPLDQNTTTCSSPQATDVDNDGIPNQLDNCVTDPNPNQLDGDGDGKGDVCDACPAAANSGSAACPANPTVAVSIYDIKGLAGTYLNQKVQLNNVLVTATAAAGLYVQVHETEAGYAGRDYSGLHVYYPGVAPRTDIVVGDRVNISAGNVADYFGQVQLSGIAAGSVVVVSHNNPLPGITPLTLAEATDAARNRALEACVVAVAGPLLVTNVAPPVGPGDTAPTYEFLVGDPAGAGAQLRVNDFLYRVAPFPLVNDTLPQVKGVLDYRNGNYKLEPRAANDLQ